MAGTDAFTQQSTLWLLATPPGTPLRFLTAAWTYMLQVMTHNPGRIVKLIRNSLSSPSVLDRWKCQMLCDNLRKPSIFKGAKYFSSFQKPLLLFQLAEGSSYCHRATFTGPIGQTKTEPRIVISHKSRAFCLRISCTTSQLHPRGQP